MDVRASKTTSAPDHGSAAERSARALLARHALASAPAGDAHHAVFGTTPKRSTTDWFSTGILAALLLHFGMLAYAWNKQSLSELHDILAETRGELHEFFWAQYDVELPKEPPKPDEVKAPEPEPPPPPPAPAPAAKAPKEEDPYDHPPAAPSQAAKVLTQKEDPDKIEDLTGGNTIVSGDGSATYGAQSANGKGDKPTTDPHASLGGVPGGTGVGHGPPGPASTGPDLSKPAMPIGGSSWNCPFPPEADADQIDQATVSIAVTVKADGTPASVNVLSDPGHGFGRAARACALSRRYTPALDRAGMSLTSSTPPINVRFTR